MTAEIVYGGAYPVTSGVRHAPVNEVDGGLRDVPLHRNKQIALVGVTSSHSVVRMVIAEQRGQRSRTGATARVV